MHRTKIGTDPSWRRRRRHSYLTSCERCPEIIVTRTRRSARIVVVALTFVASYLLGPIGTNNSVQYESLSSFQNVSMMPEGNHNRNINSKIHIFYNLFTKSPEDEERVRKIVEEQFGHIDPELHDTNVSITSIGYKLSSIPNNSSIAVHHDEGGEDLTLHAIWEYCRTNNHKHARVVYLHSKGSYHPNESNHRLRNFVTRGALSAECANLPDTCNVCSSRMSPLPHPHTSGNMWLARCDYIARLIDPFAAKEGKLPEKFHEDNPCKGRGRYLGEHWVHSHPSVMPCDLYPGKEFTWAHLRVPPREELKKELRKAPRFRFEEYVLPGMCLEKHPETLSSKDFVRVRMQNYELLYNITDLDESWWGWEFLQRSISDIT
mmetsp:Transcript_14507/g.31486  ORF Transcript_14507/g.31486 Transcript_14507/m.31486 type:complete len:376 (-) Transcript_14507:36-1163(-)